MKTIRQIAETVDKYIADFPPHKTADATDIALCVRGNAAVTEALRDGDGDALMAAINEAIDTISRRKMVKAHMINRADNWLDTYIDMANRERRGEAVNWDNI